MAPLNVNLKKIRRKWKLSQEEMGWLLNVTRGQIMTYEVRGSAPRNDTVSKLSKFSGLPIAELETDLDENYIPDIPADVKEYIIKRRQDPEGYDGKGSKPLDEDNANSNIYKEKYLELLESRVHELEQDKEFLKKIIESNLTPALSLLRALMASQTAHDEVVMKALDRLIGNEEGTLSAAADSIETTMNQKLNALQDVGNSSIGNKLGKV